MRHAEQDIAQVLEGIGIPYTLPMIAPVIRSGRPGDTAAVVALLHETFEDTWRPELTPSAIAAYYGDRVAERFVEERVRTFLVADAGGEVAGMISREGGFIDALHVGARFRRRGIGRALVEAAEVAMRAEGVLRLARALRTQLDWYDEPWSPPTQPELTDQMYPIASRREYAYDKCEASEWLGGLPSGWGREARCSVAVLAGRAGSSGVTRARCIGWCWFG